MMKQSFHRKVEVLLPNIKFTNDELTIEFNVPFDNDIEPNESSITVYNLSRNTRNNIKKNQKITVNAGYDGDVGTILEGRVSHVATDFSGADKATTIYVLDSEDLEGKKTIKKSYKKNIKASQIVNELLPKLGLPIAKKNFPTDPTYKEGYAIDGDLKEALNNLAADVGVSFYVSGGKVYFHNLRSSKDDDVFTLSPETGLIGVPEPFEDSNFSGFRVKCLLQHRINVASIIDLQSKYYKGKLRVLKGSHNCSSNDFLTDLELIW